MPNVAEQLTSLDEFVAWERDQPERYEYAGGVITMMTGGSAAHVTIAMNLAFALRHALRGTGDLPPRRRQGQSSLRSGRDYRSDLAEHRTRGSGPQEFDYFATPSIRQCAIVEQDERLIDLYTRAGDRWTDEIVEGDAVLKLSSIDVEVSLDVIYDDTELDATRRREGVRQIPVA